MFITIKYLLWILLNFCARKSFEGVSETLSYIDHTFKKKIVYMSKPWDYTKYNYKSYLITTNRIYFNSKKITNLEIS